jgi:hypothetical protein
MLHQNDHTSLKTAPMHTKIRVQQWNTFICKPEAWTAQCCGLEQSWSAKRALGDLMRSRCLLSATPTATASEQGMALGMQPGCRNRVRCVGHVVSGLLGHALGHVYGITKGYAGCQGCRLHASIPCGCWGQMLLCGVCCRDCVCLHTSEHFTKGHVG